MTDVSFEDFDVNAAVLDTFGKPEDYLKPKEDRRLDGRTKKQTHNNIIHFNKEEDHHVANLSQVHNAAGLGFEIFIAGIGARHEFFDNPADIPNKGDHRWYFHYPEPSLCFALNVELKARRYSGPHFRPKEYDVEVCIERNIPYLLIQNSTESDSTIILLRTEDLIFIQNNYSSVTHEMRKGKPWNIYQDDKSVPTSKWKKYFRCNVFDCKERFEDRKIDYHTLKRDESHDMWESVVEYFRSASV